MRFSWRTEWSMALLLVVMFGLAAWTWNVAPDRLPVHWGISGQPDRWGGKFEGLLLAPCIGLGIYLLMLFLPRIDPGRLNYESFAGAYHTVRLIALLALAGVEVAVVLVARGYDVNMSSVVSVGVGAMFVLLGNLFSKLRPNWFVGLRTPWTLSSKLAWVRTHRAGGWVFILFGLLLMLSSLVRTPSALIAVLGIGAIAIVGLAIYSYVVWRSDPDKTPPAGTTPAE